MNTEDAVRTVSNYVNNFGCDYEEFAKKFGCEHRTLQQNFTRLCVAWLKHLSETEYYDLRNQASVEFAKAIKDKLGEVALPMI